RNGKTRTLYTPGELENTEPEMTGRPLEEYMAMTSAETAVNMQHALQAIASHLSKVPGRKNLIWITGSFPLLVKTEHVATDYSEEMKKAARALNDANVGLYPVDARGLVALFGRGGGLLVAGLDTMNNLAKQTGGHAYYADNGIEQLIREAVEDS